MYMRTLSLRVSVTLPSRASAYVYYVTCVTTKSLGNSAWAYRVFDRYKVASSQKVEFSKSEAALKFLT